MGSKIHLEDLVNFIRNVFELSKEFSLKHELPYVALDLFPSRKADLLFFDWITSTTHDAYIYEGEGTCIPITRVEMIRLSEIKGFIAVYFFEKTT